MKKLTYFAIGLAVSAALFAGAAALLKPDVAYAQASACTNYSNNGYMVCAGTGTNDNDVLFTANGVDRFDICMLLSQDGVVDVSASLDGTNFSTAIALEDRSATTTDKVLETTADGMFAVVGKHRILRVLQDGMTASAASMLCYARGR